MIDVFMMSVQMHCHIELYFKTLCVDIYFFIFVVLHSYHVPNIGFSVTHAGREREHRQTCFVAHTKDRSFKTT